MGRLASAHSRRKPASDHKAAADAEIRTSADERLAICDITRALAGQCTLAETAEVIATHLRRFIPSSLAVSYLYNPDQTNLRPVMPPEKVRRSLVNFKSPWVMALAGGSLQIDRRLPRWTPKTGH